MDWPFLPSRFGNNMLISFKIIHMMWWTGFSNVCIEAHTHIDFDRQWRGFNYSVLYLFDVRFAHAFEIQ